MRLSELTKPGTHFITEPVRIPSGTHLAAEPGARLVGGVRLAVTRVHPDGICECDLAASGITPAGFLSRGFGRSVPPSHSELFIDGRPACISQYPKKGAFLKITGIGETVENEWKKPVGKLESGFFYEDARPAQWAPGQEIWVHGYWAWDWAPTRERVDVLDTERGFIKNAPPYGQYTYTIGQRFYFFNIREEVTEPGDYCLDFAAGKLYFRPFADTDIGTAELILSTCDAPALLIEDVRDVTIEGFTIEAFRGVGIQVKNAENVRICGCEVKNIGSRAVAVASSRQVTITGCHMHDTGDGCIHISAGDRASLTRGDCEVTDCHLHHAANWDRCYEPPIKLTGVGLSARNNVIHDCPHTAILYHGNDIEITDNEIFRVVQETGDAGAIYAGRDYTMRGNVISRNFLHHVGSGIGMGTMGIYNDDCLSGTVMNDNVFYRVQRAVFLGGGVDFEVHGNLFIDCTPGVEIDGRGQSDHPVWRNMVTNTMRERFYNVDGKGVSAAESPYIDRYPSLAKIHAYYQAEEAPHIPPSMHCTGNFFCSEQKIKHTWSTEGVTFDEADNVDLTREEMLARLNERQRAVVLEEE